MKPLSQFSDDHLIERLQGLAKNLFFANGRLLIPSDIHGDFNEVYEETLRRGPLPKLEVEQFIKPKDPRPIIHEKYVVRYSSRERLEKLKAGIVSFSPARVYDSLTNVAQRDNELQRSWHEPDTTLVISGISYPASNRVLNQPLKKDDKFVHYHSMCMSFEESPKLQRAFDATGYILISDFDVFYDVIKDALFKKFGYNPSMSARTIQYYDDREKPKGKTLSDYVYSKSILYKYQKEIRIVVFNAPLSENWLKVRVAGPSNLIFSIHSF